MKTLALCFVITTFCFGALAQNYSIDWHTIDGGGGTSTGGVYSVSGTIGQPDAGAPMTNGPYSVTGGFWVLPEAVQTPGAPTLRIARAGTGQATISWSPATPGFALQEAQRCDQSHYRPRRPTAQVLSPVHTVNNGR